TNLSVPYDGNIFNNGPKFGVDTDFHSGTKGCSFVQLTGCNVGEKGASSDQLLRENRGLGSEFVHMNYMVQPKGYTGGGEGYTRMQYKSNGSYLSPVRDPAQAFTSLITG